ncbi:MAG TPA: hypothetical protein VFC44_06920 [Candidatus Saccharimonadales bacterium]|nr:hypothetical protein [Candidatus Saccharimonadales bacterium]
MSNASPFLYRVALLLVLMLIVSVADLARNGAKAIKFREYGFILIAGVFGAVIGTGTDPVTSSISPDYFVFGKGLEAGPNLPKQAALLGMRVGFSGGIMGGAIALFACRGKRAQPPARFTRLLECLWMPISGAVLGAAVARLVFSKLDPVRFAAQLDRLLAPAQVARFRQVWWIHVGLYAGLIAGLAAMIFIVNKKKSRISPAQ